MNIGQVLECHLGWAASRGWQADRREDHGPVRVASPVFDGATLVEIDNLLIASQADDPDSPVKFKVNEKEPAVAVPAKCGCTTAATGSASTTK